MKICKYTILKQLNEKFDNGSETLKIYLITREKACCKKRENRLEGTSTSVVQFTSSISLFVSMRKCFLIVAEIEFWSEGLVSSLSNNP